SVWDFDPPGSNQGPPSGSIVIINEGHTITVNTNSKNPSSVEVHGRLHLGTTNGHNLGTVTASGTGEKTIQLQSSTFPGGNFTSFVASGGGTIEYNGTLNLPIQATYNHLRFTGSGTKILGNVNLAINGNLSINEGIVNNAVNNRDITLVGSTSDFLNNAVFNTGNGSIYVGRNLINSGSGTVLNSGNGTGGLRVAGNLSNTSEAFYNMGTDNLTVDGNFSNEGTFVGNSGEIEISGSLNNLSGSFSGGSGDLAIGGNITNNATFNAESADITTFNFI